MRLSEQKCLIIAHVIPSIASSIFFRKCFWIRGTSRNVGKRTSADWAKYNVSPFAKLIRSHARPLTVTRWISRRSKVIGTGPIRAHDQVLHGRRSVPASHLRGADEGTHALHTYPWCRDPLHKFQALRRS